MAHWSLRNPFGDIITLIGGGADYAGSFESASPPTVLDITDGQWGWWFDTVDLQQHLLRNRSGALYSVELSTPVS